MASLLLSPAGVRLVQAVDIPLDSLTPVRIGYIDLQKVFDTYPEKSFAEGDLLREIEKRKKELSRRQREINLYRQQIATDQASLDQAKAGQPVSVPANLLQTQAADIAPASPASTTPKIEKSTTVAATEPYYNEDPLLGLPGHEVGRSSGTADASAARTLPGMQPPAPVSASKPPASSPLLDLIASATVPVLLNPEATAALQKRIDDNRRALDRATYEFKDFRSKALDDMKMLQNQKTYDVMSKIYAVLQTLARDEGINVVLDKAYVLYGEDTIDLSEKLISRLQQEQPSL